LAFAHQIDLHENCSPAKFRGKANDETGIKRHTLVYGTVPQRWGEAKAVDYVSDQTHDATATSQRCVQMKCVACGWKLSPSSDLSPESLLEGQEDCLYLSVFTPPSEPEPKETRMNAHSVLEKESKKDPQSLMPVVFHIHHGQMLYGFHIEHGEVRSVVQRGVVVSSANFRLGAFGFLAHPDIQQVNVGQQDLTKALEWVQRHICSFQGNPNQVTVTGSSSGASQVLLLLASQSTKGLFHSAWVNSPTQFGMPDFFSADTDTVFEKESRHAMFNVGCGTLQCLKEMPAKRLLLSLIETRYPLAFISPDAARAAPSRQFIAYDGVVIPDMKKVACEKAISKRTEHVVVGQSKDELDSLKFQLDLPQFIMNLVAVQADTMQLPNAKATRCLQKEVLKAQGVQETAEDALFNFGSYLTSTSDQGQPRWHFLLTAPASKTKRTWHTLAELLCWSPDPKEETAQYHPLTKEFVYGNASPQLMSYVHENFISLIRTKNPGDTKWVQTAPAQQGGIGGLPTKIMDQAPLSSQLHTSYHHSNYTIHSLHGLLCSKTDNTPLSASIERCKKHSSMESSPEDSKLSDFQRRLSTLKKGDLLFSWELMQGFPRYALNQGLGLVD
jgi:carboxylesterase type B